MSQTVGIAMNQEVLENLRLELRRGCLIVAVLAELRHEQYGYTLRKSLAEHGIAIDEGTLYPLLRRLETQGLLASEWREQDKRNKRFYRLAPEGGVILTHLLEDWKAMYSSLETILKDTVTSHSDPNAPPAVAGEAPGSIAGIS
jgi:PadR family transcriptional regulator, regulatory protein PadR